MRPVDGPLVVDDEELVLRAALDGVGFAFISEHKVASHLAAGSLVRVLEDWCSLKKLAQSTDHELTTAERPDWVELIGSMVTRIPEFCYGTIARPIRP
jgi:DNA-binding transcriptional LysR family regulator